MVYTMHIQGIYNVYVRYITVYAVKSRCITFTENYAVLRSSVFYIRLPSTMAWVYYIETPKNT